MCALFFSCAPSAGSAQIEFEWSGDAPPYDGRWFAFIELRAETAETLIARAEPRALDGEAAIELPRVPTGQRMIVRAEIRPSPWRNDRVHYQGATEPFAVEPGEQLRLTAILSKTTAPGPTGEGPRGPEGTKIRFDRSPWGTSSSGGRPIYRVEGEAGAGTIGSEVIIFDRPEAAEAELLGRATIQHDGSFGAELFGPALSTLSQVYAAIEDGDGKLSDASPELPGLQATPVAKTRWTATLLGKISGENYPNPHRIFRVARLEATREQNSELIDEPSTEELRALAAPDGDSLRSEPSFYWELLRSSATPPGRAGAAMTFDRGRGRAQLFGGFGPSGRLHDVWEWNGETWTERAQPANGPGSRDDVTAVYMSSLERTVIFGGATNAEAGGNLDEVWSFDARRGRWSMPPIEGRHPSPRAYHAVAYDSLRGRMLIFGGEDAEGRRIDDLWIWDGREWTEAIVEGERPSARLTKMAYDSHRDRLVLFGGTANDGGKNDTWEWDGSTWSHRLPAHAPGLRSGHTLVYDEARRCVLLFGGVTPGAFTDETWEWDGTDWTQRHPEHRPRIRGSHASTYDSARGRVIIFGGYSMELEPLDVLLGDLWEWDGDDWIERRPSAAAPRARHHHGMVFDEQSGSALMFGGAFDDGRPNSVLRTNETWTFDDSGWRQLAPPGLIPAPRVQPAMAFDPDSGTTLMFGGHADRELDESWRFDGRAWQRLNEAVHPSARTASPMIYQPARRSMLLFGGGSVTGDILGDTWERDESGWIERETLSESPPARFGHELAWDPIASEAVLFSGNFSVDELAAGTWIFDGDTWRDMSSGEQPQSRDGATMTGVDMLGGVVLFGGASTGDDRNALWLWADHRWRTLPMIGAAPTPRTQAAMVYDARRRRLVLFGGNNGNFENLRLLDETWTVDVDGDRRAGLILDLDAGASGLGRESFETIEVQIVAGGTGGVVLSAWDVIAGRWERLAENTAELDAPALLVFRSESTRLIGGDGGSIALRLEPAGGGRIDARVALDDLAVSLDGAH